MPRLSRGVRQQTGAGRVGQGARKRGAAANEAARTAGELTAKFPGRCHACNRPILQGALIANSGGAWLHKACATIEGPPGIGPNVKTPTTATESPADDPAGAAKDPQA